MVSVKQGIIGGDIWAAAEKTPKKLKANKR